MSRPGATVTSRLVASVAVGTALVLGITGCGLTAEIATQIPYSPSDGINVSESGPVEVRNALIVIDGEESTTGNFIAGFINTSESDETVTMQIGEGEDAVTQTVRIAADEVLSLGVGDDEPLVIEGIELVAGATLPVYFQSGEAEGTLNNVPVLNGSQDYLRTLVPSPSPSRSR